MRTYSKPLFVSCLCISTLLVSCGSESLSEDLQDDRTGVEVSAVDSQGNGERQEAVKEQRGPFDIPLDELDPGILQRARYHLSRFRGTTAAPTWSSDAALGDYARVLFMPGMKDPGYYEFSVTEGGYLIISAGPHDSPLTNLSYRGERVTQQLIDHARQSGASLTRLYKLSPLTYGGEDEGGVLISELIYLDHTLVGVGFMSVGFAVSSWYGARDATSAAATISALWVFTPPAIYFLVLGGVAPGQPLRDMLLFASPASSVWLCLAGNDAANLQRNWLMHILAMVTVLVLASALAMWRRQR